MGELGRRGSDPVKRSGSDEGSCGKRHRFGKGRGGITSGMMCLGKMCSLFT